MAGRPTGPVWPEHWAYDAEAATVSILAHAASRPARGRPPFTLLYSDPSLERMALFVQQQLQAVGVDLQARAVFGRRGHDASGSRRFRRMAGRHGTGTKLSPPVLVLALGKSLQLGTLFESRRSTPRSMPSARRADDDDYKAGVAAFQRAIVDDPPAIFLAWSERARAVSTRFDVPVEPGRDILEHAAARGAPSPHPRASTELT